MSHAAYALVFTWSACAGFHMAIGMSHTVKQAGLLTCLNLSASSPGQAELSQDCGPPTCPAVHRAAGDLFDPVKRDWIKARNERLNMGMSASTSGQLGKFTLDTRVRARLCCRKPGAPALLGVCASAAANPGPLLCWACMPILLCTGSPALLCMRASAAVHWATCFAGHVRLWSPAVLLLGSQ